ncbi:MAG: molybdenum cofactor biosynthesis protein MoaE [Candidatus Brockarchaeota archaeon]|nr:molybdenum cofactor biosynthesis protein MoaE [Candidatus Brockarchaeota archaeon]
MIRVTEDDFSIDEVASTLKGMETGAIVFFLGVVKGFREGETVSEMIVEAYREAAEAELEKIRRNALEKFRIIDAAIIHRVGRLKQAENIVLVAASAESRREAFKACSWIIDEVKARAPIWKKEVTPRGERWVKEAV